MNSSILFVFAAVLALSSASQPLVWTGNGNTSVWDDYRNWDQKRIPTSSDFVIINSASAQVTLDVNWASVATLQVSAGTFVQPQSFSIGTLIVDNQGIYKQDSGNGLLILGSGNITSSNGFVFSSGYLQGSMTVGSSSVLDFDGAAAKGFSEAKVTVAGSATCSAGATINFNGTAINFAGGLTLAAGAAVNFIGITTGNQITGGLALDSQAGAQFLVETNFGTIKMGSNAALTITKQQTQVGTLNMDDSSVISIAGTNTGLAIGSATSKGTISTLSPVVVGSKSQIFQFIVDGNAPVSFGGAVAFGSLNVKSGSVVLSGSSTADTVQFGVAAVSGVSNFVVGDLKVTGPSMTLANTSISVTGTASFNGQIQVSSGSVSLGKNAQGTASTFQVIANNGIPVAGTSFNNDGRITISTQFTFTQLNAQGAGVYALSPQAGLLLNNAGFTAGTVILNQGAVLQGQASSINVQSTAAADLKFVDFTVDGATFHCPTPCPAITSNGISTSFNAQESKN